MPIKYSAMIKKYAAYNYWANKKLIELLATLPSEVLLQEVVSSFTSIQKTLYHIYDAEHIWYQRLIQSNDLHWPPSSKFQDTDSPLLILEASETLLHFVNGKDESYFQESTEYHDTKGNAYQTPNEEILHHVFNHSAFHRGQLITLLRQAGIDKLPQTDFIAYVRNT